MAEWVIGIVSSASYFSILLLMFIENVFPPIPSELIMPLAGYIATQGKMSLAGVIVAGMTGSVLGALPLYYLGRKIGEQRLKEFADHHGRWLTFSGRDVQRAGRWFERYGGAAVLLCRLMPGVRSFISIPAGVERMPLLPFLICTAVGSGIWAALLAYIGYFLGRNFQQVEQYMNPVVWGMLGIAAAAYVIRIIRHKQG